MTSPEKTPTVGTKGQRSGGLGPARQAAVQATFLLAFADTGTIRRAAELANITRNTHYDWLRGDEHYAAAFREAEEQAADTLEEEARRRAIEGVEEPVGFYMGKHGGTFIRRYSDPLLKFLLEGRRRSIFGARTALTGPDGEGPAIVVTRIERVIVDPVIDEDGLLE